MEIMYLKNLDKFKIFKKETPENSFIDQISTDSRTITSKHALFIALAKDEQDGAKFLKEAAKNGAKYAIIPQSHNHLTVPKGLKTLKVKSPLNSLQELAKSYREQFSCKILAITGSYGKTNLKDLLVSMLGPSIQLTSSPESFNSQVGVPISLLTIQKEHDLAIIEAGISEKKEMEKLATTIQPDYSIVTNISDAHIATLNDLDTIASEKKELLKNTSPLGWILTPSNPILTLKDEKKSPKQYFWDQTNSSLPKFSKKNKDYLLTFPDNSQVTIQMNNPPYYYVDLMNTACQAAYLLKAKKEHIIQTIKAYQVAPPPTTIWRDRSGATIIHDKNYSHPLSAFQSLKKLGYKSLKGKKILTFDPSNLKDHHEDTMITSAKKQNIDHFYLIKKNKTLPSKNPSKIPFLNHCGSINEALENIKENLQQHDKLLIKESAKSQSNNLFKILTEGSVTNRLSINLSAISENIKILQKNLNSNTTIMPIVKAHAYGTDSLILTNYLERQGIKIFGVANADEGIQLREAGIQSDLFIINTPEFELSKVVKWNLSPALSDLETILKLEHLAQKNRKNIKVHLHIDTGMSRFGCRPEQTLKLAQKIQASSHLTLSGLFTHFSKSEDIQEKSISKKQLSLFSRALKELKDHQIHPQYTHISNSAGVILGYTGESNTTRIGLAMFGLFDNSQLKETLQLTPALTLSTRIVGINHCVKGETVSYGCTYTVTRPKERIAILPLGYFDGFHQKYRAKWKVLIQGKEAPMIGAICMDFMMVDITDIPEAHIGDKVLVFGENIQGDKMPLENLMTSAKSNIREFITCLGPRIQRVFTIDA